jgi:hypothetical protein
MQLLFFPWPIWI